jgi:tetratricopeptide (TPR) repeat protein/predicted Ser/Thr protein kinase
MSPPPDDDDPPSSPEGGEGEGTEESEEIPGETAVKVGAAFARGKPARPAGAAFAGRRIAQQLFGGGPLRVGRFTILRRLGAGGMGVVYQAQDPALEREVALKLIEVNERTRADALKEAKALARLSHPNVVPVFDVGTDGDQVYIVMEYLNGETLGQWSNGRPRDAILAAYRQAGAGLAAAHDADLVHRDFKPSNAIVAADGRVRVIDFGLAVDHASTEGVPAVVGGTPGFMAPEQASGDPATPLADQYSFAVSLERALNAAAGGDPSALPGWLVGALARGRATDPGERFGSMAELLAALEQPAPRRTRVRRATSWLAGGALAVVLIWAMTTGGRFSAEEAVDCEQPDAPLAAAWPDRAAALARLGQMGSYGRELAQLLGPQLNAHAMAWTEQRRDICLNTRQGGQPTERLRWRLGCQQQQLQALRAIGEVVQQAVPDRLADVAMAVQALPDAQLCSEPQALREDPPPPAIVKAVNEARMTLATIRVAIAAGRLDEAYASATKVVADARALRYLPLLAEALLLAGQALLPKPARRTEAVPLFAEAYRVAMQAGVLSLGIEAWARRAWVEGNRGRYREALDGLDVLEPLAMRAEIDHFVRALFQNNVGSVARERGSRTEALERFQRALELSSGVTGLGAVELVNVKLNLGITTTELLRQDDFLQMAEQEFKSLVGSEHPETLDARWYRGRAIVSAELARALLRETCDLFARQKDVQYRQRQCWAEVAFLSAELGERTPAKKELARAQDLPIGDCDYAPELSGYALLWDGDVAGAVQAFMAAAEQLQSRSGGPKAASWYDRYQWADVMLGLGRALRIARRGPEAILALDPSIAVLSQIARDQPAASIDRRLTRAREERAAAARMRL